MPFAEEPVDGRNESFLLVTYAVEPHIVLRCGVASLRCTMAYNTSAAALLRRRLGGDRVGRVLLYAHPVALSEVRGGSSCSEMELDGQPGRVCIGHWHNDFSMYFHFLYFMERWPPYRITSASFPFRFRPFYADERDRTQFVAGTLRIGGTLHISLGIADCVAVESTIQLDDVAAMLRGDLVIPRV